MKIAPLYHALAAESWCTPRIVHTGQHYDVLWTPSADGNEHLAREGLAADKVQLVGNIMPPHPVPHPA